MEKSLNWTWVGVATAIIIDLIISVVSFTSIFAFLSIIGSVLQTWVIIFFACFGISKCQKSPFKQRTLWISLACAVGYYIIMELFTSLMTVIARYVTMSSENLLPVVIGSILFSVVSIALLVLAYILTRFSTEGKRAFALKWNKWMLFAVIVTAAFAVYRVFIDISMVINLEMINSGSGMILSLFSGGMQIMIISMICRGAVLFL